MSTVDYTTCNHEAIKYSASDLALIVAGLPRPLTTKVLSGEECTRCGMVALRRKDGAQQLREVYASREGALRGECISREEIARPVYGQSVEFRIN